MKTVFDYANEHRMDKGKAPILYPETNKDQFDKEDIDYGKAMIDINGGS